MPPSLLPKARRGGARVPCWHWDALLLLLIPNLLLLLLDVVHTAAFFMPFRTNSIRFTATVSTVSWPPSPSRCVSLHDLQQPTCSTVVAAAASQPIPPDLVDALAERPWRTGLEPAEDVDMLEVSADCIEVRTGLLGWEMLKFVRGQSRCLPFFPTPLLPPLSFTSPHHQSSSSPVHIPFLSISSLIQGTIPPDLVGTLFRNGAGRIRVGSSPSTRYDHWFDGDGMVAAATFTLDGRCYFRQKYLRGAKFLAQEKAGEGRLGSRGVWTQRKGEGEGGEGGKEGGKGRWWQNIGRLPGNPLNTNVLVMGGAREGGVTRKRVWALCEGGPPFEFDPVTLDVQAEPELFGKLGKEGREGRREGGGKGLD